MISTKSDSQPTKVEILKSDSKGRVHRSPDEIDAILDEFELSAMSGAQFARHYGLKYPTFASWRAKRRENGKSGNVGEQNFSFLEVAAHKNPSDAVSIEIADSIRFEVHTKNQAVVAAQIIKEIISAK